MRIVEWILNDQDDEDGVLAVSLVSNPAIELDMQFFQRQDFLTRTTSDGQTKTITDIQKLRNPIYGYNFWEVKTRNNEPWKIDTSHPFCIEHAKPGNNVYHITEIWDWANKVSSTSSLQDGWITESDFTSKFRGNQAQNYNLDQQLYNCRHTLVPVYEVSKVPTYKLKYPWPETFSKVPKKDTNFMKFEISNKEKRQIKGVAMVPDKLIYRTDGQNEYYGYFKKETIKKMKQKYGFNRELTIQHQDNITGTAILMDSWIYSEEKNDNCGINDLKDGSWCLEYKILSDKLWDIIKMEGVKGFSIEAILSTV